MLPGDQGSVFTFVLTVQYVVHACSMRMSGTSVLELELVSCVHMGEGG